MNNKLDLEIIVPVYNEEEQAASTILSLYKEIGTRVRFRFIISEDGSTNKTKDILQKLSHRVPMVILSQPDRVGYSQAILRALRVTQAPFICCVDSDGQYDSKDFWKLWNQRLAADVVIGYRTQRRDKLYRIVMSRIFYYCFRFLFPTNVHDPSCAYLLFSKRVAHKLTNILGFTNEGFGWEFMARIKQCRYTVIERPVTHLLRKQGKTKIYFLTALPFIVIKHIIAMIRVMTTRHILPR